MAFDVVLWGWIGLVYLAEVLRLYRAALSGKTLKALSVTRKPYKRKVSLIVPFKGMDFHLEENVKAFLKQGAWETIFVVDDFGDPAYKILKKFKGKARIVKSQILSTNSGKCSAVLTGARAAKGEILAFADSDSLTREKWLSSLVDPLQDERIGVTTGYRWYVPGKGLASHLKSAWDEVGISMMLSRAFVWGGSYALRRKDFEKLGIAEKWAAALSDDTVVGRAIKKAGKRIYFSPRALVSSGGSTTLSELKEFTNRQLFMVRNFGGKTWFVALIVYGFSLLVLLSGIVSLAYGLINPFYTLPGILLLITLLFPIGRSYLRRKTLEPLIPGIQKKPSLLAPLATFLLLYNILHAGVSKKIVWRGREYHLTEKVRD